jgi:hypothetical protein
MLQRIRFVSSITLIYVLTIGTISGLLYSSHLFGTPVWAVTKPHIVHHKPIKLPPKVISGKPVRIVIVNAGIDLIIDKGQYNETNGTWTLSETHAQFAVMTALANDHAGTTFVYGHGTDAVFGKIGTSPPPAGTIAQLYTDNNHIFSYKLETIRNLLPTDTSIFDDTANGPPQLIVQTCTGAFSQWRTMFIFTFEKVT